MPLQTVPPELAIIIVSWNVRDLLFECLKSIEQTREDMIIEIIVVDNASTDESVHMVRTNFPQVRLIALEENRGFAAANNVALSLVRAPLIMLLNPDTLVMPGALKALSARAMQYPDFGVIGPMLLNARGETDHSCREFPPLAAMFHQYTLARYFFLLKPIFRRYMMLEFDHKTEREVDQIMGACMLIRKDLIDQTGPFDESFFMFFEEVDLCYRIKAAGYPVIYTPSARITHLSDQSTKQVRSEMMFRELQSMFHYFRKRHQAHFEILKFFFVTLFLSKQFVHIVEYQLKLLVLLPLCFTNRFKGKRDKYLQRRHEALLFLMRYAFSLYTL